MDQSNRTITIPSLGSTGWKFGSLTGDQASLRNLVDVACIAFAKLADRSDPVIVESWRALDRQYESGRQDGYAAGYRAGLAAGDAVKVGDEEVSRIMYGKGDRS